MNRLLQIIFLTILSLLIANVSFAATIEVTTTDDEISEDDDCSLREAIVAANTNTAVHGCTAGEAAPVVDVINVPAGTYDLTLHCDNFNPNFEPHAYCGQLEIYEDVSIEGAGEDVTIIGPSDQDPPIADETIGDPSSHRIFYISGSGVEEATDSCDGECEVSVAVTIQDLTLQNGYEYDGGAVYAYGGGCSYPEVTLRRVTATENFAVYNGGAVYVRGRLVVEDSDLNTNTAGHPYSYNGYGGAIYFAGLYGLASCGIQSTISGSDLDENKAGYAGGAISVSSLNNVTVTESVLDANGAKHYGAGIYNHGADLTVQDSEIINGVGFGSDLGPVNEGHDATYYGGGIFNVQVGPGFASDDDHEEGYGPFVLTVQNSNISDNAAFYEGGGIGNYSYYSSGTSTRNDPVSANNSIFHLSEDSVVIENSEITGNEAFYGIGGGIFNGYYTGPFSISQSTIADNTAFSGGGIYNAWNMTISQSTVSGNTIPEESEIVSGSLSVDLTVTDETHVLIAFIGGGGIVNEGALDLTNSTVSGNETGGSGGGIANAVSEGYHYAYLETNGIILDEDHVDPLPEPGADLNNVTVTDNTILAFDEGTIIVQEHDGYLYVANGGGIASLYGEVRLNNTVVAGNTDEQENEVFELIDFELVDPAEIGDFAPDCWVDPSFVPECDLGAEETCNDLTPVISSGGYNLIGDNTECDYESNTGDKVGTGDAPIDALLGPLADHGGPTLNHMPLKDSPVLDMGNPAAIVAPRGNARVAETKACLSVDQNGVSRPQDGNNDAVAVCDIGAVEARVDCAGIPNGVSVCVAVCEQQDIFQDQIDLDGSARALNEFTARLQKKLAKRNGQNAGQNELAESNAQYNVSWTSTWAISSLIQTNCTGGLNCFSVSNVSRVQEILEAVGLMSDSNKALIRKLKKALRKAGVKKVKRKVKRFRRKNNRLTNKAEEQANAIPATTTQCDSV